MNEARRDGSGRFSWRERITRGGDFEAAYRKGRKIAGTYFVAFVLPTDRGLLRMGVVASRRVGGAVARNRAKRLLREVFRQNRPGLEGVSADLVLVARSAAAGAAYETIEESYVRIVRPHLESTRGRS